MRVGLILWLRLRWLVIRRCAVVGAVLRFLGCVLYPRFRFGFGLGSVGAVFPRQRLFGARWYREG